MHRCLTCGVAEDGGPWGSQSLTQSLLTLLELSCCLIPLLPSQPDFSKELSLPTSFILASNPTTKLQTIQAKIQVASVLPLVGFIYDSSSLKLTYRLSSHLKHVLCCFVSFTAQLSATWKITLPVISVICASDLGLHLPSPDAAILFECSNTLNSYVTNHCLGFSRKQKYRQNTNPVYFLVSSANVIRRLYGHLPSSIQSVRTMPVLSLHCYTHLCIKLSPLPATPI